MTIRLSIKRRSLIIGLVMIFILALAAAILIVNKSEQTQAEYYSRQLNQLNQSIESIGSISKQKFSQEDIQENIKQYQAALSDVINNCEEMSKNYDRTKSKSGSGDISSLIEQTSRLCSDLEKVSIYAINQSKATGSFLLLKNLDASKQDDAHAAQDTLTKVRIDLKELGEDSLNDPAVPEQISLIEHLEKLLKEAETQPEKLNIFNQQLQKHQANIFNARTYYWNNTIDIAAASRSVIRLQEQFSQL